MIVGIWWIFPIYTYHSRIQYIMANPTVAIGKSKKPWIHMTDVFSTKRGTKALEFQNHKSNVLMFVVWHSAKEYDKNTVV